MWASAMRCVNLKNFPLIRQDRQLTIVFLGCNGIRHMRCVIKPSPYIFRILSIFCPYFVRVYNRPTYKEFIRTWYEVGTKMIRPGYLMFIQVKM